MSTLQSYTLLGLICAFKSLRRNSVLYAHEKMYRVAKAVGMSVNTFKQYLKEAEELGLLKEEGNAGNKRFVKLSICIETLIDHNSPKHLHFFKGLEKRTDYKYYVDLIKYSIPKLNFEQQQFNISQNSSSDRKISRYKAQLKKYNVSCEADLLKCTEKNKKDIVTGAFHLAKMLGCSPSTAGKLLTKWANEGKFKRVINVEFRRMECTHESFDALKYEGYKYIYPDKSRTGFFLNLGSVIVLNSVEG